MQKAKVVFSIAIVIILLIMAMLQHINARRLSNDNLPIITTASDTSSIPPVTTFEPSQTTILTVATTTAETETLLQNWEVPESSIPVTADGGENYQNKIIMLGDSTTYGMYYYSVLPLSQVWTRRDGTLALFNVGNDKIRIVNEESDIDKSISSAIYEQKPEILVVTLGINGVSMMSENSFKIAYQGLIDMVKNNSPNTTMIINSIYPITKNAENSITNAKIRNANQWLYALANDNNLAYLDSYSLLADNDGNLKNEYCNGDGMHLSKEGLMVVLNNIRTHIV